MKRSGSNTPEERFRKARARCQAIATLMRPTEKTRPKDAVVVMITADLWKRIYDNARKGAML